MAEQAMLDQAEPVHRVVSSSNGLSAPAHSRSASGDSYEGLLLSASELQVRSKPSGNNLQVYNNNNNNNNSVLVVECPRMKTRSENLCCDRVNNKSDVPVNDGAPGMGQAGHRANSNATNDSSGDFKDVSSSCCNGQCDDHDGPRSSRILPSVDITKSAAFDKLEAELESAQKALKLKEEEVTKLSKIREEVESELHELTASLFQEAHRMVEEANIKAQSSERSLAEANMKIDGLETEVAALKTLVLTSTPARPNRHMLHVKNDSSRRCNTSRPSSASSVNSTAVGSPALAGTMGHTGNGSISTGQLIVGAGGLLGAKADDIMDDESCINCCCAGTCQYDKPPSEKLIDPGLRKDFLAWRKEPSFERGTSDFLERLYREDIDECLNFPNAELSKTLRLAVEHNALCINPLSGKEFEDNVLPSSCSLFQAPLLCRFQVKLMPPEGSESDEEVHFYVCQLARNRIISVCDCLTYLRYIKQGLVKSHHNDVYWQILDYRKKMALARLGFTPE